MDLDLKNIHVLITGASGGIGLAASEVFLQQGAKVTAHYNTNPKTLERLITEYGPNKAQALQANLSVESNVVQLFSKASASFGTVQVIVVNHGVSTTVAQPVVHMSLDQWKSTFDTNLTSSFLVAREFLKHLEMASESVKNHASIIFIGSTAGKIGEAGNADYAASKSAMMYGLTLSLKNEIVKIAPKGRVNCIAPGWVRTPMAEESLKDPAIVYSALATTPLKKVALASDIASQIAILSSQAISGHISGQVLVIAGGMEGRLLNSPEDI